MQVKNTLVHAPSDVDQVPRSHRIHAIDSLRGIAALVVVFHHLDNTIDLDGRTPILGRIFHGSPLRLLVDGRSAVLLFFILSGFALSISIGRRFEYRNYLIKRICRLMIPCTAAVLLSAGMYLLVSPQPIPALGSWFNQTLWSQPVTWNLIARHLLMTGDQADTSLSNVLWSLVVELRVSLIFPVLYLLVKGRTWAAAAIAVGMQLLFRWFVIRSGNVPPLFNSSILESFENVGYYLPFFIAGILVWDNLAAIRRLVARFHRVWIFVALLIGLRMLESGIDFEEGVGSLIVLLLCVSAPYLSRALSHRWIEWLGKISYSLYLVHLTVLSVVFHLLYGKVNSILLGLGTVVGSLLLAHLFYVAIEAPSMQLGRRWATRKQIAPALAA